MRKDKSMDKQQKIKVKVEFIDSEGKIDHVSGIAIRVNDFKDIHEVVQAYTDAMSALIRHEISKYISYLDIDKKG